MLKKIKWLIVGVFIAYLVPAALFAILWKLDGGSQPLVRRQPLPSGKVIGVTSFNLVWGIEHSVRDVNADSFALEYVSTQFNSGDALIDTETVEVFELVRPICEQWGFKKAYLSAFPTVKRKGRYFIYNFDRLEDGSWKFERKAAKVFVDD